MGKFLTRGWGAAVLVVAMSVFAGLVWIAREVYDNHPFSLDEHNYVYQAGLFASGRASEPVNGRPAALQDMYFVRHKDRQFSKYPPFFPLVLSAGVLADAPETVNPLISALFLCIVFILSARVGSPGAAAAAVLLAATNPYFLGYGASYFAQSLSLLLTAAVFLSAKRFADDRRQRDAAVAGLLIGLLLITRPLDALCAAVPAAWLMLGADRSRRTVFAAGLPVALITLGFFAYNALLSGRFGPSTYEIATMEFRVVAPGTSGPLENLQVILSEYAASAIRHMWPLLRDEFFLYCGGVVVLLAGAGAVVGIGNPFVRAVLLHFVLIVGLYNFHHTLGWPQYGARYYYPVWAGLVPLAALAIDRAVRTPFGFSGGRMRVAAVSVLAAVILQLWLQGRRVEEYRDRFAFVRSVRAHVEAACAADAIVFYSDRLWWNMRLPRFTVIGNFVRNGGWKGGRLSVHEPAKLEELRRAFPEKPVYEYDFSPEATGPWRRG